MSGYVWCQLAVIRYSARGMCREKDLSTKQHQSKTHPRVFGPYANQERPGGDQPTSSTRQETSVSQRSCEITRPDARLLFPKHFRLLKSREFDSVLKSGRRMFTRRFVLYVGHSGKAFTRLGLTTSRKSGSAVQRNRIRRCVREAFRLHPEWFVWPVDLLVIAKPAKQREPQSSEHPQPREPIFSLASVVAELGPALRWYFQRAQSSGGQDDGRATKNDSNNETQ